MYATKHYVFAKLYMQLFCYLHSILKLTGWKMKFVWKQALFISSQFTYST